MATDDDRIYSEADDLSWLDALGVADDDLAEAEFFDLGDNDVVAVNEFGLPTDFYFMPAPPAPDFDDEAWQSWLTTDVPPDHLPPETLLAEVFTVTGVRHEQNLNDDIAGHQRAAAALRDIGLEVPAGLDFATEAFTLPHGDEDTQPMYLLPGVLATDTQSQAMLVLLESAADGSEMQALAVPYGAAGTPDFARDNWETVRDVLVTEGPDHAFDLMRALDAQQVRREVAAEVVADAPDLPTPEWDIDR